MSSRFKTLFSRTDKTRVDDRPLFLLYGTGWVGGYLQEILQKENVRFVVAKARMENRESVTKEIEKIRPTHVLLAAGMIGKPNVDWCEDHKVETLRANVIGTLNLIDVCHLYGIHVTYYASGCIYRYTEERPEGTPNGFSEADPPNFAGSFYSTTKRLTEDMVRNYPNVLTLRLRAPIVPDLIDCPRNFIFKILTYKRVVNIKNSMIVLPELLPVSIQLAKKKRCGILNFVNPGCISHNEIFELYREYVDPDFQWENFTLEEQSKVLKADRSDVFLDTTQLEEEFPSILPIRESIIQYVMKPAVAHKEKIVEKVKSQRQV